MAHNTCDFASNPQLAETIRPVSKHLVFDIDNRVVKTVGVCKHLTRCFIVIEEEQTFMAIAECQLFWTGEHAVAHYAAQFAGFEHKRIFVVAFRYRSSWREPDNSNTGLDIRSATHDLYMTVFITRNIFNDTTIVNFAD